MAADLPTKAQTIFSVATPVGAALLKFCTAVDDAQGTDAQDRRMNIFGCAALAPLVVDTSRMPASSDLPGCGACFFECCAFGTYSQLDICTRPTGLFGAIVVTEFAGLFATTPARNEISMGAHCLWSVRFCNTKPWKLKATRTFSGQERFGNMTRVYYKEAAGAIVVFDSTRAATYEGALRWKADLDQKVRLADGRPIPSVLLANKVNLAHFLFVFL
jgi:hypothetical protein